MHRPPRWTTAAPAPVGCTPARAGGEAQGSKTKPKDEAPKRDDRPKPPKDAPKDAPKKDAPADGSKAKDKTGSHSRGDVPPRGYR